MSKLWDIGKAIRATDGDAMFSFLYKEWQDEYISTTHEDFMAFQHYVQTKHRSLYKKYVTYARVMGWV